MILYDPIWPFLGLGMRFLVRTFSILFFHSLGRIGFQRAATPRPRHKDNRRRKCTKPKLENGNAKAWARSKGSATCLRTLRLEMAWIIIGPIDANRTCGKSVLVCSTRLLCVANLRLSTCFNKSWPVDIWRGSSTVSNQLSLHPLVKQAMNFTSPGSSSQ